MISRRTRLWALRGAALAAVVGGSLAAAVASANTEEVSMTCGGYNADAYVHLGEGIDTTMEAETVNRDGECYYAYLFASAYNVLNGTDDWYTPGWTVGYQSPEWFESGGALSHNSINGTHDVCLTTSGTDCNPEGFIYTNATN